MSKILYNRPLIVIVSMVLIVVVVFLFLQRSNRSEDTSFLWPDTWLFNSFTTLTIDAKLDDAQDWKMSESEFSNLALEKCSGVLKQSKKYQKVQISPATNSVFLLHPLSLGITFHLSKTKSVNVDDKGKYEIAYRASRTNIARRYLASKAGMWTNFDVDEVSPEDLKISSASREEPSNRFPFLLVSEDKAGREATLGKVIEKYCGDFAFAADPNFDVAKEIQDQILAKISKNRTQGEDHVH